MSIKDGRQTSSNNIEDIIKDLIHIREETSAHRKFTYGEVEKIIQWFKSNFPNPNADRPKYKEESRRALWVRQGGLCAICGVDLSDLTVHVDHIITLDNGGWTDLENLQLTCSTCNTSKRGDNHPDEILDYIMSIFQKKGLTQP